MPKFHWDVEQLSDEWNTLRAGQLSGSVLKDAFSMVRGKPGDTAQKVFYKLAAQRLTRAIEQGYVNEAMTRGTELEPVARKQYETVTGRMVTECGWIQHDEWQVGASPDGLIVDTNFHVIGGIEIKCPYDNNHAKILDTHEVPPYYMSQVVHLGWMAHLEWVDFCSFHPKFPDDLKLAVVRVNMTQALLDEHELKIKNVLAEIDATYARVTGGQHATV